jgi:hypothetical protein
MNDLANATRNGVVAVSGAIKMIRQGDGVALHVPPQIQPSPTPFQIYGPYKDGSDWKIGIYPGTVNGITPVVGAVTGSGGTTLTAASRITLATGEDMVVLGVKTNLETRAITRLTVEVLEDSALDPVVDTGARTRIAYIPIALLTEVVTPSTSWSLTNQIAETNLNYATFGTSDFTWRT